MIVNDLRRAAGIAALCTLGLLAGRSAMGQETGRTKNMLWRVESDSNVLYILGSVHVLPKSMYPLNPAIERAFDSSEKVAFEVNLDSMNQMSGASALFSRGMYTDGRTLKKSLSKSTYRLAQKRLKKEGLDIAMLDRFKPWVVAFMLTGVESGKEGFDPQYGIDFYFHRKANGAGKPVLGLETIDDQIGVFAEMPDQTQEDFLRQMLTNSTVESELDIILAAWKKGETKALEELLRRYTSNDTAMFEAMLFRRNRNWMPAIEGFLHDPVTRRYLVIVGSLHLVGDRGVVEMLRAKGYRVEQM
jgi:hypothetical protein